MQYLTIKFLITFVFVYWNIVFVESKHRLQNKEFGPNIVGGEPVPLEWFPYMVQFINLNTLCAGVILNSWCVLTSAHCFDGNKNIDKMTIQVGSRYLYDFNTRRHEIQSFVTHENYSERILFENDIAIVFLKERLRFGKLVKKGILVNHASWMNADAKYFIVAGWGFLDFHGEVTNISLLSTYMEYVPIQECSRLNNLKLSEDMFCLYGSGKRDTCSGDSGGGVLWRSTIVGLTSHGDGCAKKDKPSMYTNLWYMRNWIRNKVYQFIDDFCSAEHQDELPACNKLNNTK